MKFVSVFIYIFLGFTLLAENIDKYNIDITLNSNGTLHIKEKILYNFKTSHKKEILRYIPQDFKLSIFTPPKHIDIQNISISAYNNSFVRYKQIYTRKNDNRYTVLKITLPERLYDDTYQYTIEYDVKDNIFDSNYIGMSAIKWKIIDEANRDFIKECIIRLFLPSDINRFDFIVNFNESQSYSWLNNNTLLFTKWNISSNDNLNLEINFPKNLISQEINNITITDYISYYLHYILAALFTLFGFLYIFLIYGFNKIDTKKIKAVSYPPNLSILQYGLILDMYANKRDFTPAVIELANMGYLDIVQEYGSYIIKKSKKKVVKSDLTKDQYYFLNRVLFPYSDEYVIRDTKITRQFDINKRLDRLNDILYQWAKRENYIKVNLKEDRKNYLITVGGFGVVLFLFAIYKSTQLYQNDITLILLGASLITVSAALFIMFFRKDELLSAIIASFSSFFIGVGVFSSIGFRDIIAAPIVIFLIVPVVVWYFYTKIGSYTKKGTKIYKHLIGYKKYLESFKRDKETLRFFLIQKPNLIHEILPYAMLFNIENRWMGIYRYTNIKPDWFKGNFYRGILKIKRKIDLDYKFIVVKDSD